MNEKVVIGVIVIVAVVAGTLAFTTPWKTDLQGTRTVTDMSGREVEIPENVNEIVGLEAGSLRLITYLNATDKVVGVEQFEKDDQMGRPYILAHPELLELSSIGPIHGGDAELIAAQDPDVIFWTYCTAKDANDLQEKTGIPVVALTYGDLGANRDTFHEALRLMGEVLGKENRAEQVIQYIESTIQHIEKRTENISSKRKPEVYIGGVGHHGTHGIVSTEPQYTPFQFVNAKNVADKLGVEHVMVGEGKLVQWNPDVIFLDEGGYSLVMNDLKEPQFRTMKAVREENLYGVLPYNYYTTNYGTVLADSYYIGKVLYPEVFGDVEPSEKADEIYEELVGEPVYDDMKENLGGFKGLEPPE